MIDGKHPDREDLRLFLAVARGVGLSSAVCETGRPLAASGRRMHALGAELPARPDRGHDLTPEGRRLRDKPADVEARIARLGRAEGDALPLAKVSAGTWTTFAPHDRLGALTCDPPDVRLPFVPAEVHSKHRTPLERN